MVGAFFDRYSCKNLMKISLFAHSRVSLGSVILSRNNGKEYLVSIINNSLLHVVLIYIGLYGIEFIIL